MRNLRTFQKIIRAVSLVGQLGFMVITPPLVLIYLAHLLQTRCGWGVWVMLAAIVVGLVCAGCSVVNFCRRLLSSEQKRGDTPSSTGFNRHD